MAMIACPECQQSVSSDAASCPGCGKRIKGEFSPGLAMVLSLIIPGAGQLYGGKILRGLLWFVFVVLGYICFIVPGLVLHLACIINAKSR